MTIETTTSRSPYLCNGSVDEFDYGFKILEASHLKVYHIVGDVSTLLTYSTDYTLTGVGAPTGGTVTILAGAPAAGTYITLLREVPATQLADYVEADNFPAETHEAALDKLTMLVQQLNTEVARTIRLSQNDPSNPTLTLPFSRGLTLLGFDTEGAVALYSQANLPQALITLYMQTALLANDSAEARAVFELVIGTDVQAYDAATAKTNVVQAFTATQKFQQILEKMTITASAPAATQNFDWRTQGVQFFTTNAANNWTLNVRGDGSNTLNSLMAIGESATLVVWASMGATSYYASAMTIDGAAVTPKWIGGTAPVAGDASCINIYTYTIVKTADATFTVVASKVKTS